MLADDPLGRTRENPALPLDRRYEDAFAAIESSPHQLLVIAEMGAVPVGTLQLTFLPGISRLGEWRGQIEGVRIAASARGSGLGRAMVSWAVDECRRRGCGLVQLTSDASRTDARRFYESLGFVASHVGMKLHLGGHG